MKLKELDYYWSLIFSKRHSLDKKAYFNYQKSSGSSLRFMDFYGTESHVKHLLILFRKEKLEQLKSIKN